MNSDKSAVFWKGFKKVIMSLAVFLAFVSLVWSAIKLVGNDIPALIRGYEEIPIEYTEDYNWMGIPYDKPSKTVKKEITFEDAFSNIVDRLILVVLSSAVFIAEPAYRRAEAEKE